MRSSKKKDGRIGIRLSGTEIKMLAAQAAKLGLSVSAYIRMLIYLEEKK